MLELWIYAFLCSITDIITAQMPYEHWNSSIVLAFNAETSEFANFCNKRLQLDEWTSQESYNVELKTYSWLANYLPVSLSFFISKSEHSSMINKFLNFYVCIWSIFVIQTNFQDWSFFPHPFNMLNAAFWMHSVECAARIMSEDGIVAISLRSHINYFERQHIALRRYFLH